jgi:hypothetical protein
MRQTGGDAESPGAGGASLFALQGLKDLAQELPQVNPGMRLASVILPKVSAI